MPGALVHLAAGFLLAAVIHFRHFKLEYSLAVFLGNLLPDVIKFGISALRQGTFLVFSVQQDETFHLLSAVTGSPQNWFTVGFFVLVTGWLLVHYHLIRKKKMMEYDELYVFLLIGVLVHLVLDVLIIEKGPWL